MDTDHYHEGGLPRRRPTIEKMGMDLMQYSALRATRANSTASVKQQAHFHYEHVDFETIEVSLEDDNEEDEMYNIRVAVGSKVWVVRRGYDHFKMLDQQVHVCIFNRNISGLLDLEQFTPANVEDMNRAIGEYLSTFSDLCTGNPLYCGTVLNFFEIDSTGKRLIGTEECSAINIPAIAAARAIKKYSSQASDELSLEVGDMVSVIDKPEPHESTWWRGKKKFEVGLFPSECVEVIGGDHKPSTPQDTKPVLRRRGKLITFLRMFFSNRPNRSTLKGEGIVKERVFGCDLAEHLSNSTHAVPQLLSSCCSVIEKEGLINGIYRLTGVASNIQQLRAELDEGAVEVLDDDKYRCDMHTITAVLKMYFRELPNPLMTYQLYDSFSEAVESSGGNRINKIKTCIARLPPPHYRTAKYLFTHLHNMSTLSDQTGMDSKNLAIVWSPNLMRSKQVEGGNVSGVQMLHCVSVQATLVEALISNCLSIFTEEDQAFAADANKKPRPISVAVSSPGRLLTLTEAQNRISNEEDNERRNVLSYTSEGTDVIPVFHTVIDFDTHGEKAEQKERPTSHTSRHSGGSSSVREKSPSHKWRSIFHRTKQSSMKGSKKKQSHLGETAAENGSDITENEIGHLSRRIKSSSSTSNINLLADKEEDNSEDGVMDDSGALMRAASHESFFDSTSQSSSLPQADDEALAVPAVQKTSVTPGVVFRPAYNKPIDGLMTVPKATWKQSTSHMAEEHNSNIPTMHRSTQRLPQPQILPALAGRDQVDQRAPFSSVPHGLDLQTQLDCQPNYEEENVYEEVIPRSSPHPAAPQMAATDQQSPSPSFASGRYLDSKPSNTSPLWSSSTDVVSRQSPLANHLPAYNESSPVHMRTVTSPARTWPPTAHSAETAVPASALKLPTFDSKSGSNSAESAEQLSLSQLEREWGQAEMQQCMNQAEQARLSRSFSNSEYESRFSSRSGSRRVYGSQTEEPPYADVQDARERNLSGSVFVPRAPPMTRGNAPPQLNNGTDSVRSAPFDMSSAVRAPVPVKSRVSDIDSAIANPDVSTSITAHFGRRPSRKMEYVNRKSYEADPRKVVRRLSSDDTCSDRVPDNQDQSRAPPSTIGRYVNCGWNGEGGKLQPLSSSWSASHSHLTHSSSTQSNNSNRYRFDSLGSDSHSSTEERAPKKPPRQRPTPAPRKLSVDSPEQRN